MLRIGLTGGIGSGKSTVANIFVKLGIPVFFADTEAKKFLANNQVKNELRRLWGDIIFHISGEINKAELAKIVFNSETELSKLNKLIHPLLMQEFDIWCNNHQQQGASYIIIEAAILFEAEFNKFVDKSICVTAPTKQRIARVVKRDNVSEEQVQSRMNNQWKQSKIIKNCDFEISNANNEMILSKVVQLSEKILS